MRKKFIPKLAIFYHEDLQQSSSGQPFWRRWLFKKHPKKEEIKTLDEVLEKETQEEEQPPQFLKRKFKKEFFRLTLIFIIVFVLIVLFLYWPLFYLNFNYWFSTQKEVGSPVPTNLEKSNTSLSNKEQIPAESRLLIPKIQVEVPIIFPQWSFKATDQEIESILQEALSKGVAHYYGTANPGEIGNVFISGHSSDYWWSKGQYKYVFALLDKLIAGDEIIIYHQQKKYVYKVYNVFVTSKEDTSVLQPTKEPILTLMTCTPPGTNLRRLIVQAKQIYPNPSENKASEFFFQYLPSKLFK